MTNHVRQTIPIDKDTWWALRARAALERKPAYALVNQAIRQYLEDVALAEELQKPEGRA